MILFTYAKIPEFFRQIIPYLKVTLEYVVLALLAGLLFGGLLAWAKLGHSRILRGLAYGYTTVIRCVPAVVLLFVVYYGLPRLLKDVFRIQMDTTHRLKFVVITLALFSAGSISEAFRSAYQSIDKTQFEAVRSVGMTPVQGLIHIIFPQMLFLSIPNLCNTLLALLKEGALAYTIGLYDLLGRGQYIIGKHHGAYVIEMYVTLILIYWPISLLITWGTKRLENRLNYYRREVRGRRDAHAS